MKKIDQKIITKFKELDLGKRKVSRMNFSKVVTLPKAFTDNCLDESMMVTMTMTRDGKLTLTPVKKLEEVIKK